MPDDNRIGIVIDLNDQASQGVGELTGELRDLADQIKKMVKDQKQMSDQADRTNRTTADESLNAMPDESIKDPSAKIIGDEFTPRLLACQPQIERILSQGRPEKGERRFKVMQLMLTQTPQNEIAEQLRTSAATITRDKDVIKQSWQRIKEVLY